MATTFSLEEDTELFEWTMELYNNLRAMFIDYDCMQVEINLLAKKPNSKGYCMRC